jgi:hypothetical protein
VTVRHISPQTKFRGDGADPEELSKINLFIEKLDLGPQYRELYDLRRERMKLELEIFVRKGSTLGEKDPYKVAIENIRSVITVAVPGANAKRYSPCHK